MTPEQRAEAVLTAIAAARPTMLRQELLALIARAIEAAVAEERAR